jgi:uncharacterized membrane protein YdjX (TVP38/TMEM64 family)
MKQSLRPYILAAGIVSVVGFVLAGVLGNDRTGLAKTVADLSWMAFVVGLVLVVVLSIAALVMRLIRRDRSTTSNPSHL